MTPTLLYYLGLLETNDMDGDVINELFDDSFLNAKPIPKKRLVVFL